MACETACQTLNYKTRSPSVARKGTKRRQGNECWHDGYRREYELVLLMLPYVEGRVGTFVSNN